MGAKGDYTGAILSDIHSQTHNKHSSLTLHVVLSIMYLERTDVPFRFIPSCYAP